MPMTREKVFVRAKPEVLEWIAYLTERWSAPAARATMSDVIREALRRAVDAEKKSEKKSQKGG